MSDPLREALEMIASIADPYPARLAREALAVAPEPTYEWRICGRRGRGGQWEGLARRSEPSPREVPELRECNQEVWLERRVVPAPGPWERVEVEDGEG